MISASHDHTNGRMLDIQEAAELLGYTVKGLRKIISRSRVRACGGTPAGPVIKFFQTARGAPIRFRPEWIEEFVATHTYDPQQGLSKTDRPAKPPRARRSHIEISDVAGLDSAFLEV